MFPSYNVKIKHYNVAKLTANSLRSLKETSKAYFLSAVQDSLFIHSRNADFLAFPQSHEHVLGVLSVLQCYPQRHPVMQCEHAAMSHSPLSDLHAPKAPNSTLSSPSRDRVNH